MRDKWQVRDKRGIKKKRVFFLHFAEMCSEGGGGGGGGGGEIFREIKSNFSLDFPAFRPSVLVGPRSKVVPHSKSYTWAPVLRSFDNSGR